MAPDELRAKILTAFPDAEVDVRDLTGTGDHWEARVTSAAFLGKSSIERHQLVYGALAEEMKGPIHALSLKTLAPGEPVR